MSPHRASSTPVHVDSLLVRQSTRSGPLRFPALTRRFVLLSFFPSACGAKLLLGDRLGNCRARHLRGDSPLCFRSPFGTFRFVLRHLDNLRLWICPSRQHPIHPICGGTASEHGSRSRDCDGFSENTGLCIYRRQANSCTSRPLEPIIKPPRMRMW